MNSFEKVSGWWSQVEIQTGSSLVLPSTGNKYVSLKF